MRILFFLLISVASFGQIPLWQLEYAPDSTKVIGAAADGEPIWKTLIIGGSSIDSIFIEGDSLYYVIEGDTVNVGYIKPDQTVSITGAGITNVTGTYPNFTVTSTEIDASTTNEKINSISWNDAQDSLQVIENGIIYRTKITGFGTGNGTVTSVNGTGGTGISVTGGPITTSGSLTITNTAPDQTVSITGATGTYPNFTVIPESTTVTDGATIDLTKTTYDITADVKASSIDSTHIKISGIGTTDIADGVVKFAKLQNSGVTASTYNNVTVNNKGIVTSGSNVAYLTAEVDGDPNNEKQTLSQSFTGTTEATYSLNLSGGSVKDTTGFMRLETMFSTPGSRTYQYKSNLGAILGITEDPLLGGNSNIEVLRTGNQLTWGLRKDNASNGQIYKYNGTAWALSSDVSGITSLNGLTPSSQTFATGTSGTDFNISSSTSTHTFNFPTASASNRGLLSSADHTLFSNKFTLPSLTSGSVLFSNGTTIAQDNANFFWNDATNRLSIKSGSSPVAELDVYGRIQLQNASGSVYFGNQAGSTVETGTLVNVGVGTLCLLNNTTGNYNMAVGPYALYSNTTGGSNIAIGNSPMYFGNSTSSIALGTQALYYGGATESIAIGKKAMYLNTGNFNTVVGTEALRSSSSGAQNTSIGYGSGYSNTGSGNVFIGMYSGFSETGSNKLYIENSTGVPLIGGDFSTNRVGINKAISSLSTTLHVGGDVTIDTRTGTATQLMGNDATGKLCNLSLGAGLTITSGTLNQDYGAFTVAATTGGSGLVGPLDGDPFLTFTAGSGMTITRSGTTGDNQTLTFASTGGTTNLSYSTKSGTDVTLESSTGADVIFRDGVGTFVNRVSANVIKYDVYEIYGQLSNTAIIASTTIDGVYRSVDFTVPDESFASIIDAKTASDEIEVLVAGTYEIHYSLSYVVPSNRDVRWRIYKNTADIGYIGELTTTFTASQPSKTFNIALAANDKISLRFLGVNGVSGTIDINSPVLKVRRIK